MLEKLQLLFLYLFASSLFLGIALTNISFYSLLFLVLIDIIKKRKNPFSFKIIRIKKLNIIIFGYLLIILIINLFNYNPASLKKFIHLSMKFFLIYVFIYLTNDVKIIKKLVFTFIITGVISGFLSVIEFYLQFPFMLRLINSSKTLIAGFGADHHISLACKYSIALIFISIYFIDLILKKNFSIKKKMSGLAVIILFLSIAHCGSRGVIIGITSSVFFLFFLKSYRKFMVIFYILLFLSVGISYKLIPNLKERFQKENFESSSNFRLTSWKETLKKWDEFIIGKGTFTYRREIYKHNISPEKLLPGHAHNNIIQFYVDYGLIGLFLYFGFWSWIFYFLIFNLYHYPVLKNDWFFIAGLISLVLFQINGLTDSNWVLSSTKFTICFIISVLLKYVTLVRLHKDEGKDFFKEKIKCC